MSIDTSKIDTSKFASFPVGGKATSKKSLPWNDRPSNQRGNTEKILSGVVGVTTSSITIESEYVAPRSTVIPKEQAVNGFKGFKLKDGKLSCLSMEYVPGQVYVFDGDPAMCSKGFHFCEKFENVDNFYSFNDPEHVFYKVKGWGKHKTSSNKIAVQYIELGEKISDDEMFEVRLSPKMEMIDQLIELEPNTIISGSMALILQKTIPYRQIGDIDITLPYYSDFKKGRVLNKFGKSGTECIQMEVSLGKDMSYINFDLFVNPKSLYRIVTFKGKEYKVADVQDIFEAKFRYFMEGREKHKEDILHFVNNYFGTSESNGCSNDDDEEFPF